MEKIRTLTKYTISRRRNVKEREGIKVDDLMHFAKSILRLLREGTIRMKPKPSHKHGKESKS